MNEKDYRERVRVYLQQDPTASGRKIARELQIRETTAQRLKKELAAGGFSPAHDMVHEVPEGFRVKGVSTLYGPDGSVRGQWVKSTADQRRLEDLVVAFRDIDQPWAGKSDAPAAAPGPLNDDLLVVYPMGDPHIGMYAWAEETGASFDLHIAETNLCAAVDRLVELAPSAAQALIINVGDFFHSDNAQNRTSRSGHALDVDTRWSKVLRVGIRAMRRCIDRALEKHGSVRVVNEIGNHDDQTSIVLSICLAQYYENNPRVEIDTSPASFHYHRFGANLIGVTHGNNTKPAELPGIMACDRAADWGGTRHRFWYTGHIHHETVKEYPGCVVETFRTLAPRDAWHAQQGYRSGRDMRADVLHREHGKVLRHIVGIEQLTGATT